MLNYSTHSLSSEGTILNTDIYSLDSLLNSTHVGTINANNQILFDYGVFNLLLNRYSTREAAVQTVEYLKANNFDFSQGYSNYCVEGCLKLPWYIGANAFFAGFSFSTLRENTKQFIAACRGTSSDVQDRRTKAVGAIHLPLAYLSLGKMGYDVIKGCESYVSKNIVESIIGLKNIYYNLGFFSIGSGIYDLISGIRWKLVMRNEFKDPGVNRLKNLTIAAGASKVAGGSLMYYASVLEWLTISGSAGDLSLNTQGATIASALGIAGLCLSAFGFTLLAGNYVYTKVKKYVKTRKDYKAAIKAGLLAPLPNTKETEVTSRVLPTNYHLFYNALLMAKLKCYSVLKKIGGKFKKTI